MRMMCRVLGVSPSGYYAWRKHARSDRETARARSDRLLGREVLAVYRASRRIYGSPRVHDALVKRSYRVSRRRVARLMKEQGLRGVSRRRRRFDCIKVPRFSVENGQNLLARRFSTELYGASNQAWVGDFTFLRTTEGWLFLAVVLDLWSRRIVGWATGPRREPQLTISALKSAILTRNPKPGLLHHVDRGIEYVSADYRNLISSHAMIESWSRPGNCLDNAVIESLFATIKTELRTREGSWATRAEARAEVVDYIDWYNSERLHSTLGYRSPMAYEAEEMTTAS